VKSSAAGRQRHYDDPDVIVQRLPWSFWRFPQRATLTQWAEPRRQARQKQGLRLLCRPQGHAALTG
jgi:hypothetical protein